MAQKVFDDVLRKGEELFQNVSGKLLEKPAVAMALEAAMAGKMNLDVSEARGGILVVSQFTLAGSIRRGRRPSFDGAALPEAARPLVDALVAGIRGRAVPVQEGVFGADMEVELVNDGPVTFFLELPPAGG